MTPLQVLNCLLAINQSNLPLLEIAAFDVVIMKGYYYVISMFTKSQTINKTNAH